MTMKNDAKSEEKLTCRFKTDMRKLRNFYLSTRKSQKYALQWAPFHQSIYCLSLKFTEMLSLWFGK